MQVSLTEMGPAEGVSRFGRSEEVEELGFGLLSFRFSWDIQTLMFSRCWDIGV